MGAKYYAAAICLVWLATPACSSLARLAPPGFIKYEDLAGDQPPNPVIKARIAARQEIERGGYPDLSATPSKKPTGVSLANREKEADELHAARDALDAAVAADRQSATDERMQGVALPGRVDAGLQPLDAAQEALAEAVASDDAKARRERGLPPRKPPNDNH